MPHLPDPDTSWLTLAMASTLAGNLTLLGSMANLIVLEAARRLGHPVTFVEYLRVGLPVMLLTMGLGVWWLSRASRRGRRGHGSACDLDR